MDLENCQVLPSLFRLFLINPIFVNKNNQHLQLCCHQHLTRWAKMDDPLCPYLVKQTLNTIIFQLLAQLRCVATTNHNHFIAFHHLTTSTIPSPVTCRNITIGQRHQRCQVNCPTVSAPHHLFHIMCLIRPFPQYPTSVSPHHLSSITAPHHLLYINNCHTPIVQQHLSHTTATTCSASLKPSRDHNTNAAIPPQSPPLPRHPYQCHRTNNNSTSIVPTLSYTLT